MIEVKRMRLFNNSCLSRIIGMLLGSKKREIEYGEDILSSGLSAG
jgi:hypothetical protein